VDRETTSPCLSSDRQRMAARCRNCTLFIEKKTFARQAARVLRSLASRHCSRNARMKLSYNGRSR
jgi:hypothetical protein